MIADWGDMEHVGQLELRIPVFRILLEEFLEYLARVRTVLLEQVLPRCPKPLRPLSPRSQRRIER